MNSPNKITHSPIYVLSGGKGIAGHTMVHSLLIQYPENKIPVKVIPEVHTIEKILEVIREAKINRGLVAHTMVDANLRNALIAECQKEGVHQVDFMGGLANYFENELGMQSVNTPGLFRQSNSSYYNRIEAIEFTLNQDDGLNPERLKSAEVILTGVSRSGKTPLSVYMSMFGWKVANVPLVNGILPPKELFEVDPKRVFGLYIKTPYLIAQRHKRLKQMGNFNSTDYVEKRLVAEEIRAARRLFEDRGFTEIEVTNKPIETTANEIIALLSNRFGYEERNKVTPEA